MVGITPDPRACPGTLVLEPGKLGRSVAIPRQTHDSPTALPHTWIASSRHGQLIAAVITLSDCDSEANDPNSHTLL
jgi:hypothetical protein